MTAKKWKPKEPTKNGWMIQCNNGLHKKSGGIGMKFFIKKWTLLKSSDATEKYPDVLSTKRQATAKCKELNRAIKSILKG